jgi:hypothetical protein
VAVVVTVWSNDVSVLPKVLVPNWTGVAEVHPGLVGPMIVMLTEVPRLVVAVSPPMTKNTGTLAVRVTSTCWPPLAQSAVAALVPQPRTVAVAGLQSLRIARRRTAVAEPLQVRKV